MRAAVLYPDSDRMNTLIQEQYPVVIFEYAQAELDCMICLWLNGIGKRDLIRFHGAQEKKIMQRSFQSFAVIV